MGGNQQGKRGVRTIVRALRQLLPLLGIRVRTVVVLIVLGLLAAASEGFSISLVIPLLEGRTEASGRLGGWLGALFGEYPEPRRVLLTALCIMGGIVLKNVLSYAYSLYFNWINTGIGHRLRSEIVRQTLRVSQQFLDGKDTGLLLNTLGTETWRVAGALSILADMLIGACLILIYGVLLLALSWKLALISLGFFVLVSVIIRLVTGRIRHLGGEATKANGSLAHRMLEIFNGLRVVRLFGNEEWEQKRYDDASQQVRTTFFRLDRLSSLVHPLSELLAAVFLIFLLAYAVGSHELAGILVFLVVLYRLQARAKILDGQRVMLEGMAASIEDVAGYLDRSDKPYIESGEGRLETVAPGIAFEQVSFGYDVKAGFALENVDFLLRAGCTTAFVGTSGAGKSTIANLVCRLYDPTSGRILAGGTDLRKLDLAAWRRRIAVVSQDVHLFDTSVEENIAYGKAGATRSEIEEAARQAHALGFIEALPDGFATRLGERGVRLSGGQKQRIALARALVRDPDILILDEATNALDLASERLVQDALDVFSKEKTVLIIAHRLHTIENADEILVLEAGHIVEQGNPRELKARKGAFAKLLALQNRTEGNGSDSALPD